MEPALLSDFESEIILVCAWVSTPPPPLFSIANKQGNFMQGLLSKNLCSLRLVNAGALSICEVSCEDKTSDWTPPREAA